MKKFLFLLLFVCNKQINAQTGIITTIAGNGNGVNYGAPNGTFSGDGGLATSAGLYEPCGIVIDKNGNIIFADPGNHRIRKISTTGIITTIAGTGTGSAPYGAGIIVEANSNNGGLATAAQIWSPTGIIIDKKRNICYADNAYQVIRKIDTNGVITTIAGTGFDNGGGYGGYTGDGGPATAAQLGQPRDIAVDSKNNLFIIDSENNVIRKIDTSGIITTIAGNGTSGYSGDGGLASAAKLSYPMGITIDNSDNIYFLDGVGLLVRKIDTNSIITTIAGIPSGGWYNGDGIPASTAYLNYASAIRMDRNNNILLMDAGNFRFRKISGSGIITTIAGNGIVGYYGDSIPAISSQIAPYSSSGGITTDSSNTIYFTDLLNDRIRKISNCNSPLSINISGNINICGGTSTTLKATGGSTYLWSANAGNAKADSIVVTPITSTTYTLFSESGSCASVDTIRVIVNPVVTITGNTVICSGSCTTLSASGATTYTWSTNAGGVNTSTVNVCPVVSTIYTVSATTGTCTATQTMVINVSATPVLTLTVNSYSICPGGNIGMSVSGASSYTWAPAGSLSNANASYTFASPTTTTIYTVTGKSGNCISAPATVTVNINSPPNGSITSNNVSCNGACNGSATVTPSGGMAPYTYTWTTGSNSATVNNLCAANYQCYIQDAHNCSSSTNVTIIEPSALIVTAASTTICSSQTATLTASAIGGTPAYTYTWLPSGSTSPSVVVTPSVTTNYTINVTDVNNCLATNTTSINVNSSPTVSFTLTPNTTPHVWDAYPIYNGGTPPYSYSWNWGDGSANSTTAYPSHTYSAAAWYNVCPTIVDANGCSATVCQNDSLYKMNSTMVAINVINGSFGINQNINYYSGVYIYPNPTSDQFFIETNTTDKLKVDLFDVNGRHVFNAAISDKENINVASLDNGAYTLTIKTAGRVINKKLVILR